MFTAFENFSVIGALAFKDLRAVMQGMGQEMYFGFAPRQHFAIHPNIAITIVERNKSHCSVFVCGLSITSINTLKSWNL